METTLHSAETRRAALAPSYPPLEHVMSPGVPTPQAAYYLNRRPQTLRGWACAESYPAGLRPIRVNGRLAWPVDGIKRVMGASK